jgi:hypothetical protein
MELEDVQKLMETNNQSMLAAMTDLIEKKLPVADDNNDTNNNDNVSNDDNADTKDNTQQAQQSFDPQEIAKLVAQQLSQTQSNDAVEILYDDKFKTALRDNPGLKEFLDGNDDYGQKRLDQISSGSYEEKTAKLDSIVAAYNQAQAATGGQAPVVSPEIQKKADEADKKYDDIFAGLAKGEFTQESFAKTFAEALDAELAEIA